MKKPSQRIEESQPRNIQRADIAPANGYAMVVDGRFKTQFEEEAAAMKAATLQQNYLQSIPCCRSRFTMRRRESDRW
ncbi:MAG: hypothetical protein QOH96_2689 [Blastocatellia bacterium]|jgi:hypothetical protein|nr:hypothetical protein [Blastocatellia bacterium]